jgi:DNA-binding response OmpR family regulator
MFASEDLTTSDFARFVVGTPSRFLLGPGCWYEPTLARIINQGTEILLTPRENTLLTLLLRAPYQWHRTTDLAARLEAYHQIKEVSFQSVRQSMMGLRAKLKATTASLDLLQCRPGHGYGLFPPQQAS